MYRRFAPWSFAIVVLAGAAVDAMAAPAPLPAFVAHYQLLRDGSAMGTATLTLTQGKYHQVKRMLSAVGNRVEGLHRHSIGALMRRVLASNSEHNVFQMGFQACDSYATGAEDMAKVTCPVLFILGSADQMTPPKAARSLVDAAPQAHVVTLPAGHSLMTEAPDGVLRAMREQLC